MLCDWRGQDGAPIPIAPREVLRRVVQRARAMGFEPRCALELEFYLLRETSGSLLTRRPAELVPLTERSSTYGVAMGSRQEPVGRLIRESMLAYGLPVEACNPETGPGQFEITLRHRPALEAADDAFLFKSAVKELAAQQELMATFMAKPSSEWAGNSCHVHMSLTDEDGRGVFHDPDAEDGLSATLRSFVGGTLEAMPGLTAIMAPTDQLLPALHRSTRGRARRRRGGSTTARRACARSARGTAERASSTASPAATSTRTSPSPRRSPLGWTGSSGASRRRAPTG